MNIPWAAVELLEMERQNGVLNGGKLECFIANTVSGVECPLIVSLSTVALSRGERASAGHPVTTVLFRDTIKGTRFELHTYYNALFCIFILLIYRVVT